MVLQSKKKSEKGSDDYGVSCDKELNVINIFEIINGFFFFLFSWKFYRYWTKIYLADYCSSH